MDGTEAEAAGGPRSVRSTAKAYPTWPRVRKRSDKGTIVVLAMVLAVTIAGMVAALFMNSLTYTKTVDDATASAKATAAAQAALEVAIRRLRGVSFEGVGAGQQLPGACLGIGAWTPSDDSADGDIHDNDRPDFVEVAATDPLAFNDARAMAYAYATEVVGTGTSVDPRVATVVICASGESGAVYNSSGDRIKNGVVAEFESVVQVSEIVPDFVLVTGQTFNPSAGIVTGGDIEIGGNAEILGAEGNVHANGNADVTGSGHVTGNLSAAGIATGSANVDGTTTSSATKRDVPLVDPDAFRDNHAADIDYVYKEDGTVKDGSDSWLGTGSYGGMTYDSATGTWHGSPTGDGTYFFETDVSFN